MEESKSFSKAPWNYHWVFVIIFIYFLFYSFIFNVNKLILTTVKKKNLQFKSDKFKIFDMQKESPRVVLPKEGNLQMCCEYSGSYLCVCVILIKLQKGFAEFALLHYYSPVSLLHVCRGSSLQNTSGVLLLSKYNFIYDF